MKSVILAGLIAATAGQASALSCNYGNTATAWDEARRVDMSFVAVQGRFWLADAWRSFEEEDYELQARFSGVIVHPDGTTTPYNRRVQVFGSCINGDCGYLQSGQEVLTFIFESNDGLVTYSMPCSSFPLGIAPEVKAEVLSCMNDGPCEAEWAN